MKENEIARIIDHCLNEITSGSATEKDCLLRYPALEEDLRMAFSIQRQFKSIESIGLNEQSRVAVKKTILFNLPHRETPVTKRVDIRYRWQNTKWRFAMTWVIIVITVLSLLGGTGAVIASGDALPGEFLYPVKTWTEDIQLLLAPDNVDVELAGIFSSRRMEELIALLQSGEEIALDDLLGEYRNRTELMTQAFEKVRAQDPEEAIRLQIELESRLREQARIMEDLMAGDEDSLDLPLRTSVRTMLETNTQTRLRIAQVVAPVENPVDDPVEEPSTEVSDDPEDKNKNQNQNRNRVEYASDEFVENGVLYFQFRFAESLANGVYAEVDGLKYACSVRGDLATCNLSGSKGNGTLKLFDQKTNELLYSFDYQHDYEYLWSGAKEGGEEKQQQGSSDSGAGSHDNGRTGGSK